MSNGRAKRNGLNPSDFNGIAQIPQAKHVRGWKQVFAIGQRSPDHGEPAALDDVAGVARVDFDLARRVGGRIDLS
jgi:hypothetical protein